MLYKIIGAPEKFKTQPRPIVRPSTVSFCQIVKNLSHETVPLKVHKMENFFTPILEFALFLCQLCQNIKILKKIFFDCAIIGGGTIFPRSPRTTRNEKFFEFGQIFFCFSLIMDPKYDPILDFLNLSQYNDPRTHFCGDLGRKRQILFRLVSD